jgi:hypothetical protein
MDTREWLQTRSVAPSSRRSPCRYRSPRRRAAKLLSLASAELGPLSSIPQHARTGRYGKLFLSLAEFDRSSKLFGTVALPS